MWYDKNGVQAPLRDCWSHPGELEWGGGVGEMWTKLRWTCYGERWLSVLRIRTPLSDPCNSKERSGLVEILSKQLECSVYFRCDILLFVSSLKTLKTKSETHNLKKKRKGR